MSGPHLRVEVEMMGERKRKESNSVKRINLLQQGNPLFPALAVNGKKKKILLLGILLLLLVLLLSSQFLVS